MEQKVTEKNNTSNLLEEMGTVRIIRALKICLFSILQKAQKGTMEFKETSVEEAVILYKGSLLVTLKKDSLRSLADLFSPPIPNNETTKMLAVNIIVNKWIMKRVKNFESPLKKRNALFHILEEIIFGYNTEDFPWKWKICEDANTIIDRAGNTLFYLPVHTGEFSFENLQDILLLKSVQGGLVDKKLESKKERNVFTPIEESVFY